MATQEQILQALKKADAAGNVEDAKKLARMYKDGQQSRPEINNVVEGVRQFSQGATFQSADEIEAAVKTLAKDKAISQFGLAAGFAQSPENSMGLAGALRTDTQANDYSTSGYKQERDKLRAQNKEFVRQNPKTAMALEVLGGITTPVLGTAKAASTLGKTALGSAQGAGYGALYGLGSADEMSDVTSDALTQGAVGGLIGGTLSRLGAAVAPKLQQGANELQRKGINLTPGQAFGGVTDTLEQKLGSTLPFINTRRTENIKRWNQSIIDDVIKPIGGKMSAVSDDITSNVRTAQKTLSTAYDDLLPNISLKMDKPFKDEMTEILTKASQDLTEPVQKKLSNELSRIGQQLNVSKSGQTLKGIQSDLGRKIAKYSTSTNSDDKFMGEALEDILDGMMNSMERQNPKYAGQLKK